jgi:ADP-ribose pyrophosphatase
MSSEDDYDIVSTERLFDGKVVRLRRDDVRMADGKVAPREVIEHPGAVGVVALDEEGNVLMVNQYRHPVRARLDELPAGLLDGGADESPLEAAKRELAEETGMAARKWNVLVDLHTSPGVSNEAIRIYLARDLYRAPLEGFEPEHEEATMTVSREPLPDAVRRAMAGRITNAAAVAGILAVVHGRATDWRDLRPADAPWPARTGQAGR